MSEKQPEVVTVIGRMVGEELEKRDVRIAELEGELAEANRLLAEHQQVLSRLLERNIAMVAPLLKEMPQNTVLIPALASSQKNRESASLVNDERISGIISASNTELPDIQRAVTGARKAPAALNGRASSSDAGGTHQGIAPLPSAKPNESILAIAQTVIAAASERNSADGTAPEEKHEVTMRFDAGEMQREHDRIAADFQPTQGNRRTSPWLYATLVLLVVVVLSSVVILVQNAARFPR